MEKGILVHLSTQNPSMKTRGTGILVVLIIVGILYFIVGTDRTPQQPLDIVFYNVENLFDTIDDPATWDEDFTPDSTKKWTQGRYVKKLKDLSKVISSVSLNGLPEVIGLCEIENRSVVEELFQTDSLLRIKYRVIHEESPDKRGIDVALVYDPNRMVELYHEAITYGFSFSPETTTRDILYAKFLAKKDTLHFFVNHWPSRRGGVEKSEPKRLKAATVLRSRIDSILIRNKKAKIIAMGDFNDHPDNRSMTEVMNCEPGANQYLTNLVYHLHEDGNGTYNYKGEWGMLDQFIVSDEVLKESNGFYSTDTSAYIFNDDRVLFKAEGKEAVPNRTYGGPNYYGGYSDHLPIGMTLDHR